MHNRGAGRLVSAFTHRVVEADWRTRSSPGVFIVTPNATVLIEVIALRRLGQIRLHDYIMAPLKQPSSTRFHLFATEAQSFGLL